MADGGDKGRQTGAFASAAGLPFPPPPDRMQKGIIRTARRAEATLRLAMRKFIAIEGEQRSAAFAYSAFFSLFPLMILFVTAASFFTRRKDAAGVVITYVEKFVPLNGEMQRYVFDTLSTVIEGRGRASAVALLMLIWVATQFFTTLIHAANRAWGTTGSRWWKLPLKSLALLAVLLAAVLLGIGVPVAGKMAEALLSGFVFLPRAYRAALFFVPWAIVFLSLLIFYRFAPHRHTEYSEVWFAALCAALLLQAAQNLFVVYLKYFAALNALYGAFGGIMALLLWIYVSGIIFIFCACLSAAQAETRGPPY